MFAVNSALPFVAHSSLGFNKKNSKNNKEQQQQQIESPLRTLHKMAAGKSNSLAPTQAAAGNGNGVRSAVEGGGRGEECTQFYTVPQLMLCPSNINNKHNSRRGNNNSNKSVTTAGTPRQAKEEMREGGKTGKDKGKVSWEATKVQAQMTIDTSWQLAWG